MTYSQNDPFLGLLVNEKIDGTFWKNKAGSPSYGIQDDAVIALRKMGFNGSVGDMLFQYYSEMTGKHSLMDSFAEFKRTPIRTESIDYVGKVRGDGDGVRQIYYGALNELSHPDGLSEAGSAMAGVSIEDDGSTAYYSISTPTGYKAQLIFHLNLSHIGTKAELKKYIKSLKFYQNALSADTFVFDNIKGIWTKVADNTEANKQTIDISHDLDSFLDANGEVYIGYLAPTVTDGVTNSRVEVDYFRLDIELLK